MLPISLRIILSYMVGGWSTIRMCDRLCVLAVADVQIVDVRRVGYYGGGFTSAAN